MNTKIVSISLLVIAVGFLAFVFLRPSSDTSIERETEISDEAVNAETPVSAVEDSGEVSLNSKKALVSYSSEGVSQAAMEGKALLFFHAAWCPFCRAAEADILSKYDQIPEDVTIFKVDYDSEKELRSQYGVTTQHTFVQIDSDGDEVTKWVGGDTLEDILSRLK